MDERMIEARLALVKKLEYPVSIACGVALAALYFWWRLEYTRTLAVYTWMIAFFIGTAIPKFYFSVVETRLDRLQRERAQPPLPEARALGPDASSRRAVRAVVPAAPIQAAPLVEAPKPEAPKPEAPKPEAPIDPAGGPRFLS